MKRSDFYIFSIAAVNIYILLQLTNLIIASTMATILEQPDFYGYTTFAVFVGAIVIVFNNLSYLCQQVLREEDESVSKNLRKASIYTVLLLGLYVLVRFLDVYLVYNFVW